MSDESQQTWMPPSGPRMAWDDAKAEEPSELAAMPGSALDDYTPPPKYRRWQFSCTLDVWALPVCITRYNCGGLAIQFMCFEMLTDRAHRWPNKYLGNERA